MKILDGRTPFGSHRRHNFDYYHLLKVVMLVVVFAFSEPVVELCLDYYHWRVMQAPVLPPSDGGAGGGDFFICNNSTLLNFDKPPRPQFMGTLVGDSAIVEQQEGLIGRFKLIELNISPRHG